MRISEAIKRYLKNTKRPNYTVMDILHWNARNTASENATKIGFGRSAAVMFAKRFKLKYKRERRYCKCGR